MKKLKNKILFTSVFIISFILFINGVSAATNVAGGGNKLNGNECGTYTYCFNNTTGLRFTFIRYKNKKIERCKYDSKTNTLCGEKGDILISSDYWANPNRIYFYNSNICYAYKEKLTKYERIGKWNDKLGYCRKNYEKDVNSLSDVGLTYSGDDAVAKNLKSVITKFNDDIESTGNHTYSKNVLTNMLKDMTGDKNITIDKINTPVQGDNFKIYLQVDQLLYVSNYNQYNMNSGIASIGTVSETTNIILNETNGFKRDCITLGYLGGAAASGCGGSSDLYRYGGWIGFYGDKTDGGNLGKELPTNVPGLTGGTLSYYQDLKVFMKNNTANVSNVWVNSKILSDCNTNARNIVSDYFTSGKFKSGKTEKQYLKSLYNNKNTQKCVTKSGDNYYLNTDCNNLDPITLQLYKGINPNVTDACSATSCNTQITKANSLYSGTTLDNYASKLHSYWNDSKRGSSKKDYSLLQKNLYDLLNNGVPKCDEVDFKCDPVKGTVKNCDANTTFKDNANPGCWDKGVAYNKATDPTNASAYESSRDDYLSPNYGNKCDVYCIETVTFNLPNDQTVNAYGAKAGKIFKWGINTNVNDSKFGEMKVTRTCKPVGTSCDVKNITPAYWVTVGNGKNNYINTIISLSYKEPVTNRVIDSANLKTSLVDFKINNELKTSEKSVIKTNSKFTVVANYRFDYGKELHWYSDKSQASKSVTEKEVKTTLPNPHYVEIGYGLPTDFTEPTNVYSANWVDGKGFDWSYIKKKTTGYMYATIKNVGTKNNDGTYHFDKLIRDNTSAGFNKDGSFNYTCDFSVTNELFETECKDTDSDPLYCDHKQSPKGIDVVFRTIQLINPTANKNAELTKAFPGRSGSGRKIGKNWEIWKDGNPNDPKDKTNIYDILRNTVYDRKPLYRITLDSSTIMKIREYNKQARNSTYNSTGKVENVDPYTFMGEIEQSKSKNKGYSGYNCVKNKDSRFAYCASNFLSKLYEDKKLTGDCMINSHTSTRASNFSKKICG